MLFQIKRYIFGLVKYKTWLLLFLIPPALFLVGTAMIPSHFVISQQVGISSDTPVALMSSPTAFIPAQEIISQPEKLFLSTFALRALYSKLNSGLGDYRTDPQFRTLAATVKKHISLRTINERTLQITYAGPDKHLGTAMVDFFSDRLIRNAMAGIKRSRISPTPNQRPHQIGSTVLLAQRKLLPSTQVLSFIQTIIASLLGALILAGILEYKDSSFKSERQMAEYLDLPILGSVPNLNRVYSAMEK